MEIEIPLCSLNINQVMFSGLKWNIGIVGRLYSIKLFLWSSAVFVFEILMKCLCSSCIFILGFTSLKKLFWKMMVRFTLGQHLLQINSPGISLGLLKLSFYRHYREAAKIIDPTSTFFVLHTIYVILSFHLINMFLIL